jgi:DNA polymerase (family 10)
MVSNADVIRTLERIADLLEIRGENTFKVRAYRLAALQVGNLGRSLADIAASEGGLRSVDGFGAAIADKVGELIATGRSSYLERLETEIPPTLVDILALPGMGPRTVATLWHEGGITTLDELEAAARRGALDGLPRLGARTMQNIVSALDARARRGGAPPRRRARSAVTPLAETLCEAIGRHPDAGRVEVAGSFRRRRDSCGDLDLLVATDDARAVLIAFAALPQAEHVLTRGATKSSIHVDDGFQVDCRAVAPESFGAALQYFTGSQAHNIRLRGRALRLGMTLNEYGVFRNDDGARIAGETEDDVYAALGLPWIPPQRREDPAEIDAVALTPVATEV